MGKITLEDKPVYTVNRVGPDTELSDIIEHISQSLSVWRDKHCLWDLNQMDFSKVDNSELRAFISTTAQMTAFREGKKTAFLVESDLGYGMIRMLEALASNQYSSTIAVFRTLKQALEWLESDS